jgi:hypothetical protein
MTQQTLIDVFEEGKRIGFKYIYIIVKFENGQKELIVNQMENMEEKLTYYQNAYDENLVHKHAPCGILEAGAVELLSNIPY